MDAAYNNYLELYDRGPYAPYLKEHRLAGSAPVRMLTASQPPGRFPVLPVHEVSVQLLSRGNVDARIDLGCGRRATRCTPGHIALTPPDTAVDFEMDGPSELLNIGIPYDALRPLLEEACPTFSGNFGRLHAAPFRDTFIEAVCRRLWDEAAASSPSGRLFADSVVQTLALALLRRSELVEQEPELGRGAPLAPWRLKRCLDYIGDNLGEDIGLAELAGAAGLSPSHFARAFRQATGVAPHHYLIQQRIERAKALLAGTSLPLAEIALACGFASQSHLTNRFRKAVGVTPGAYRRAL